jgi:hypothetical protein
MIDRSPLLADFVEKVWEIGGRRPPWRRFSGIGLRVHRRGGGDAAIVCGLCRHFEL